MRVRVVGKKETRHAPPGQDEGIWIEGKIDADWFARARMVGRGGRAVVAELRLCAIDRVPVGGITQEVVRRVPLGSCGPYLLAYKSSVESSGIGGLRQHLAAFSAAAARAGLDLDRLGSNERPRPRRATGRDDLFYARLASDYVAVIKSGSRAPIKELAAARGEHNARVRDLVHEARKRGLLSPGSSGVRGGELLPRAKTLLKQAARKGRHK